MRINNNPIVYQVWPRSFYDTNHDGIGDIGGVIEKLDYIKSLHVDYIWLSPVYQSPNDDYGYDVANYFEINPEFGTMDDIKRLIASAKAKGMGIIMDLVANHTSTKHPWFIEALHDKNSEKRDFYYFRKTENDMPPNNWISIFGGSAWTKVDNHEFVLTLFTPTQADLNWENPKVRQAVVDVMKFWLDLGIAGFRMDVINTISKKSGLPSKNPQKKGYQFADDFIINRPESVTYIKEIMAVINQEYECVTIGEGMLMTQQAARQYANQEPNTLNMMFHFDLHMLGNGPLGKFDFRKFYRWNTLDFKRVLSSWQNDSQKHQYEIGNYLSNHDQPRQVSRFGDDKKYHKASAKALALLNMTIKGTPFIYQGEEIGMTNCPLERHQWKDYEAINAYQVLQDMMHLPAFLAERIIKKNSRDNSRTPIQWSNEQHAGFSTTDPWMIVNPNYQTINVQQQLQDETSILRFYQTLTKWFKSNPTLSEGEYIEIYKKHKQVIGYIRKDLQKEFVVIINFSKHVAVLPLETRFVKSKVVLSTLDKMPLLTKKMVLQPYEGLLMEVVDES